jgi:glycosyltransferase involved in cell wall biosynthesis
MALIAPMQIGSGTCIKVLEALSQGVPVLATNQGLRGIKKEDRRETNGIYQFDDHITLVRQVDQIFTYDGQYDGAISYIRLHYSQEAINRILQSGMVAP